MIKSKFKRVTSLFLATLMCVTTFAGIGSTTAYAASGEKADVYMVDFPRDGDANYDGVWGHSNLTLKNGWHTGRSNFTNLKAIGSYSGNVAYCIEPGISLKVGQTMNKYDENYFNNLAANGVISGDEIRLFVGRILQYGYRGTISTSWRGISRGCIFNRSGKKCRCGRTGVLCTIICQTWIYTVGAGYDLV